MGVYQIPLASGLEQVADKGGGSYSCRLTREPIRSCGTLCKKYTLVFYYYRLLSLHMLGGNRKRCTVRLKRILILFLERVVQPCRPFHHLYG
ncbi:hypothetical protein SUGI_0591570 [Cryptomeria japonica]|nr:hypothetical protein SUGI_0591570 [Cryptomeria japonica]